MTHFRYRAIAADGRIARGKIAACNLADLEARLQCMELDLIRAEPAGTRPQLGGGISRRELIAFCFQLEQMLAAGVSLIDSLSDVRNGIGSRRFRHVVASIIAAIHGGESLSCALKAHPDIFDEVFANLIAAGETCGRLPEVLRELTAALKWRDELAAHTGKLLTYPLIVATTVFAAVLFLMLHVVPQLTAFIKGMGHPLPVSTQLLFVASAMLADYWQYALLPAVATVFGVLWLRTQPATFAVTDRLLLRLPGVGSVLHKIVLARFASTLALLHASGIPITEALRTTRNALGNRHVATELRQVEMQIEQGKGLTQAFAASRLFPPLVIRMIRVGESTGALDRALTGVSYFYSRDVRESVERAQSLIEPSLTLLLGAMLGWIMLAVLGPVYDLIGSISP